MTEIEKIENHKDPNTESKNIEQSSPDSYWNDSQQLLVNSQQSTSTNEPTTAQKDFDLLEFAMIFFAVFLGFLAENTREHIVEKRKTKEFVESMVDDLKEDTANFQLTYLVNQVALQKTDSLI